MDKNTPSKILWIDADTNYLNNLKQVMPKGIFLLCADSGQKGLELTVNEEPDLVISAVMMPDLNGFELIKKIKQNYKTKEQNCMIISNFGESMVYNKGFLNALGIRRYLIKSNHSLVEVVDEVIKVLKECQPKQLKRLSSEEEILGRPIG